MNEVSLNLDARTIGVLAGITPLILGLIMGVYWKQRRVYGGFGRWVVADFVFSTGILLIDLRGAVPDSFSVLVGNTMIIYAEVLIYEGIERFWERPMFSRLNYAILLVFVYLQAYLTYVDPAINMRIVLVSAVGIFFILRSGSRLLHCTIPEIKGTARGAASIFFLTAIFPLTRGIYALMQTEPIDIFTNQLDSWYSLILIASIIAWTFYFFLLNSARLELDLETAHRELTEIANTDPLTGLHNRRYFFQQAEIEFQRARRYGHQLAFIVLDADEFKSINDNYGHDAGDAALLQLAAIFRREVRPFDLVARFGGDEFIIMLVDANDEEALSVAERIRDLVEMAPVICDSRTVQIRLSAGVSSFLPIDDELRIVLKRADRALYHAKNEGRNLVRTAPVS